MKEENQPIKLECFVQITESNRQLIGFILLPMRTIPFWSIRKIGMMKPHWYKLHGLSQENKPELLVSVTIGNKDDILNEDEKKVNSFISSANIRFIKMLTFRQLIPMESIAKESGPNNLKSDSDLLVEKLENNEINIVGIENTEQNDFVVEIHLETIELASECPDGEFELKYTLFDKQCVKIKKDLEKNRLIIDEINSIKFRSSLNDLMVYFKRIFNLPVELVSSSGGEKLLGKKELNSSNSSYLNIFYFLVGLVHLNFSDSLSTLPTSVDDFQQIFSADDYTYQFDSFCNIDTSANKTVQLEGAIHYSFKLKLIPFDTSPTPANLMLPLTTLQSTDFNKISSSPKLSPLSQLNEKEVIDLNNFHEKCSDNSVSIPKTFAYTLSLLDCSFNKRPFPGIWRLTLQHPLADIPSAVRNLEISNVVIDQISFEDMNMRLYFTSYPEQLYELIKSNACVLTLKGPRGVQATAELDNNNILSQGKTKGIVLLENEQNEQMAMAHISVEIEELGVNFNTESTLKMKRHQVHQHAGNAFLDEDLAYKMIEELEEWKQVQQKEFLADLKRREIAHLTQLSNEWQRKRQEEEIKLQKKIEHCERLTQTLEEAHVMFKDRNRTDGEYEQTLLKTKCELERCYARKIDTLNGKILQMEREQAIKDKNEMKSMKKAELEKEKLKMENDKLKAKIQSLEKELLIANNANENTSEHMNDLKECVVSSK